MNIVIIGGSRGIGKALGDRFRARGDKVTSASRHEEWFVDIRHAVPHFLRDFLRRDRVDAVICCAASYAGSDEDVVLTNVLGTWRVAHEACEAMNELGGSVVLFSGAGVGGPAPGKDAPSLYTATKAAVVQMVECLARDYHPNVRINAVAPGPIDTGLTDHGGDTPDKTVAFVEWLLDQKHISGRLLSVKWDTPEMWAKPSAELGKLRRVT